MTHIITTQSVVFTTGVIDRHGKPVMQKVKFGNRDIESQAVDHHRHDANVVLEIGKDIDEGTADELIAAKQARAHIPELDPDVEDADPTKSEDALA